MEKAITGNLGTKKESFRELGWSLAMYFQKSEVCFKLVSWTMKIKWILEVTQRIKELYNM